MRKQDTLVEIQKLAPGSRFELPGLVAGSVLRIGPGSAYVELDRPSERTFVPKTGPNAGTEVSFGYSKDRGSWSLTTLVHPLH